ncbi:hypothetical protein JCM6882_005098 [Rhodosporidiobolus microsporus]
MPPRRFGTPRASEAQRLARRTTALPAPSDAYLAATTLPSSSLPLDEPLPSDHPSPIVVLSLNQSLIFRKFRTANGARQPCARPFLAPFIEYVTGVDPPSSKSSSSAASATSVEPDRSRFRPVIYSAMRGPNLFTLLAALDLIPSSRVPSANSTKYFDVMRTYEAYEPDFEAGDVLSLILSRETMGLSPEEYEGDVQATKDLRKVWEGLDLLKKGETTSVDDLSSALEGISLGGQGDNSLSLDETGAKVTVLLDDEEAAATQFPHSLLRVTTFAPASGTGRSQPSRTAPLAAVDLPASHPDANDTHLLALVYLLHRLRYETNIAAALRGGFVEKVKKEVGGEKEMVKRGREVCERAGIEVRREWDPEWRQKMLAKEERA